MVMLPPVPYHSPVARWRYGANTSYVMSSYITYDVIASLRVTGMASAEKCTEAEVLPHPLTY